jgi:hypothetical protein
MIGYNKSRLVYYCPIKRARTSFGPRGPQELLPLPLPFHTHNLNHVSAFFSLLVLPRLGLSYPSLPPTAHGLLTYQQIIDKPTPVW